MSERCRWPMCTSREIALVWEGVPLCGRHWRAKCDLQDGGTPLDELRRMVRRKTAREGRRSA